MEVPFWIGLVGEPCPATPPKAQASFRFFPATPKLGRPGSHVAPLESGTDDGKANQMHHTRFQNVQSLINPLILDESIALIGTYNQVRLKAKRLKTSWRIKLTKFVDRAGSEDVDGGQVENWERHLLSRPGKRSNKR